MRAAGLSTSVGVLRLLVQVFLVQIFTCQVLVLQFVPQAAAQPVANPAPPSDPPLPEGLLESERNTIDVFRTAGSSVVFVTNNALRRDMFTANVTEVPQGSGSGFLWDKFGHVVTNYHVVQGGQTFSVTLADGTTHEASVVGYEPRKDLAVLHIETKGLTLKPLAIGRSDALLVGQNVIAIGNPFGLDRTLTTGVISALGREFPTKEGFVIEDVIQTDASINPGNSGGPLLDSHGRAIGVNTAIFSPSGASAGIGFAIPVDEVNRIVPRLIRDGRFVRPAMGVTAGAVDLSRALKLPAGVVIVQVGTGSPAARAGLQAFRRGERGAVVQGDVITAINDEPVASLDDMLAQLERRQPGDTVTVTLWRNGATRKQPVVLAAGE